MGLYSMRSYLEGFNSDVFLKAIIILVRGLIDDEGTSAVGSIFQLEPSYSTKYLYGSAFAMKGIVLRVYF